MRGGFGRPVGPEELVSRSTAEERRNPDHKNLKLRLQRPEQRDDSVRRGVCQPLITVCVCVCVCVCV